MLSNNQQHNKGNKDYFNSITGIKKIAGKIRYETYINILKKNTLRHISR